MQQRSDDASALSLLRLCDLDARRLLFVDKLSVAAADSGEIVGTFELSVTADADAADRLWVRADCRGCVDGVSCGTLLVGHVQLSTLATLTEEHTEYLRAANVHGGDGEESFERRVSLRRRESSGRLDVVVSGDGDEQQAAGVIDARSSDTFVGKAMTFVLARILAQMHSADRPDSLLCDSVDSDGSPATFKWLMSDIGSALFIECHSAADETAVWQMELTNDGRLVQRTLVGSPIKIELTSRDVIDELLHSSSPPEERAAAGAASAGGSDIESAEDAAVDARYNDNIVEDAAPAPPQMGSIAGADASSVASLDSDHFFYLFGHEDAFDVDQTEKTSVMLCSLESDQLRWLFTMESIEPDGQSAEDAAVEADEGKMERVLDETVQSWCDDAITEALSRVSPPPPPPPPFDLGSADDFPSLSGGNLTPVAGSVVDENRFASLRDDDSGTLTLHDAAAAARQPAFGARSVTWASPQHDVGGSHRPVGRVSGQWEGFEFAALLDKQSESLWDDIDGLSLPILFEVDESTLLECAQSSPPAELLDSCRSWDELRPLLDATPSDQPAAPTIPMDWMEAPSFERVRREELTSASSSIELGRLFAGRSVPPPPPSPLVRPAAPRGDDAERRDSGLNESTPTPPAARARTTAENTDRTLRSAFFSAKEDAAEESRAYLERHPELPQLLTDYLQCLLSVKPDDISQFSTAYFQVYSIAKKTF